MKLVDVANSIKGAEAGKLDHIPTGQILRILIGGFKHVRDAVEGAGDDPVVVPVLGRFRTRNVEVKAKDEKAASTRRITKFVAAKEKAGADEEHATAGH